MAVSDILSKIQGKSVTARFNGPGALFPNNGGTYGCNNATASVQSMNIIQAYWSCANSSGFTISRGANTVLVVTGQGSFDFREQGMMPDTKGGEPQANVVIAVIGSGQKNLILKLHKRENLGSGI